MRLDLREQHAIIWVQRSQDRCERFEVRQATATDRAHRPLLGA
ncbi:MAG TPA: hypothetical protein VKB03_02165 [Conexibacter sp.]|nr:hypothetical protein [Conexibacter sp.]